ncbi:MAG TPA: invasion associated locus B family protein [Rhizomicrobium sp.]|nr:invasion associated locus B family protein [Rhizomicrobium sp.]
MKTLTERLVVGGVALLVGLFLGWIVRGVATYNTKAATVANYDDWRVACPSADTKDASCEMVTEIIDKEQNNPVARATITTDKDGKQLIGFTLPYGVALEAGMGLVIGKEPVKIYQYRTCNQIGCIATAPFDEKLAASLKGASDGRIMFANLEGKPVGVPLSFKGYTAALGAWQSNDAKRHSWFWRLWS